MTIKEAIEKRTQGPWDIDAPYPEQSNRILDGNGMPRADLGAGPDARADAAYIVHACNLFPELVKALEKALTSPAGIRDECLDILRRAKGE